MEFKNITGANPQSRPAAPPQKHDSFWTICSNCDIYLEYFRIYLNHTIRCPDCHDPFLAVEADMSNEPRFFCKQKQGVGEPTRKKRVNVADSAGTYLGTIPLETDQPESGDCGQGKLSKRKGRSPGGRAVRLMLVDKARMKICKKLNELKVAASSVSSLKEDGDN